MTEAAWVVAVRDHVDGCVLELLVSPGAAEDLFPSAFDPWRKRIGIRVRAQAQDGAANRAVCALVADVLGIRGQGVVLVAGETNTRKRVVVTGMDRAGVIERLAVAFERHAGGGSV